MHAAEPGRNQPTQKGKPSVAPELTDLGSCELAKPLPPLYNIPATFQSPHFLLYLPFIALYPCLYIHDEFLQDQGQNTPRSRARSPRRYKSIGIGGSWRRDKEEGVFTTELRVVFDDSPV